MKQLVITGASGGLGCAIVKAFAGPAWKIDAPTHDELDVSDPDSVSTYFDQRPVDLLICAAGIIRDVSLAHLSESAWDEVFAVNYSGAAAAARAALPSMRAQGRGHVIFISSQSAIHPPAGQVAYATAKAALLGLTKSLALQNGANGIRVNVILPGFLMTAMTVGLSQKRRAQILADHSLEEFNTPERVAKFIRHLQTELPHTSGQLFQLDSRIS